MQKQPQQRFQASCALFCALLEFSRIFSPAFRSQKSQKSLEIIRFKAFRWSEWRDSNSRPHGPESQECRHRLSFLSISVHGKPLIFSMLSRPHLFKQQASPATAENHIFEKLLEITLEHTSAVIVVNRHSAPFSKARRAGFLRR